MNARKYNVFVSVNAIASGRRSRTRDAIGAVRHVFLDADHDGRAVLSRVEARRDLPSPSYILHSSPNHIHVFWRVSGFDPDAVERLQKQLARELQTDPAATPVTQNTRLPGFFNHKRAQPHLVTIEYRNTSRLYRPADFPPIEDANPWPQSVGPRQPRNFDAPGHRPSEAVLGLGATRDCRSARRRPYVSRLLPTHTRVRAGRGPGPTRAVGVERAMRASMDHVRAARQAPTRCSVRARARRRDCSSRSLLFPNLAIAGCCQVSFKSCVHRGTSTDFSVTAHALIEPMRPTLVRRHP